ncbi:hypothetical protein NG271_534 [Saccharomyces cerevisiae synthetic construct]|uniref:Putative uncharacterized protein YDR269C n=2 Tax=Saccharomyces cerevisiae TaxID=4932 RepID=YD269_YEAST|nr:RecName: Full=Putative uncharacterized protein YDR269C [Saccharomyces cerevisiae S288C]AAB64462.1 Ydr267wp [Saccharomyces cerevisiae]KZV12508.1 hypothetical protein WN66_01341 [Saccharomyces cerevisiae]WNF20088.1 hypothetical protein NG271_534 [Saccharomyces cerevisiae synthetic construct]CAY78771.1 EC1118_1D0_5490p [Saccharomyces cerevisiae EC1118]
MPSTCLVTVETQDPQVIPCTLSSPSFVLMAVISESLSISQSNPQSSIISLIESAVTSLSYVTWHSLVTKLISHFVTPFKARNCVLIVLVQALHVIPCTASITSLISF